MNSFFSLLSKFNYEDLNSLLIYYYLALFAAPMYELYIAHYSIASYL
jgi:hypothetical protein